MLALWRYVVLSARFYPVFIKYFSLFRLCTYLFYKEMPEFWNIHNNVKCVISHAEDSRGTSITKFGCDDLLLSLVLPLEPFPSIFEGSPWLQNPDSPPQECHCVFLLCEVMLHAPTETAPYLYLLFEPRGEGLSLWSCFPYPLAPHDPKGFSAIAKRNIPGRVLSSLLS